MTSLPTTCPYCGVGCGLRVTRSAGSLTISPDATHPANFGRICSKGAALGETLSAEGRLLRPIVEGRETGWDEALELVAAKLACTIDEHGRDAVAFYVSGQLLTEDYYVANKLMKGFIGSGNIDTNSRLCMASSVAAYKRAFGADFVPVSYEDIDQAELLVLIGSNLAWCHPVLYQRASAAKERNPNLRVAVIDPRRTASCDIADLHLPIKPGTDVMLFNGLLNYLRREDALDWEYVESHTDGIGKAMRVAKESAPSVPRVAAACGVPERELAEFYQLFARTGKTVSLYSQGVNQSSSGTDKANSIINVHLATGRIGKPGMGPFSLTGQPNAMGGREVGGLANQLAAHMDFCDAHVDIVSRFWQSGTVARKPGLKAVEMFEAVERGEIRALWIMSTNPVVSMPNADLVSRALEICEFVVVSDCVRATDTTAYADVLLPAATWGEKSGTVTNSERRISRQRAFLEPPGDAQPDWWIVTQVARRMGFGRAFDYDSPAAVFREHARLSAFENDGTRDFDIGSVADLSDEEYDELTPLRWPAPSPGRHAQETCAIRYYTPTGKARFIATEPAPPAELPDSQYPFVLLTGRVRDQWHTMTRTGKAPRLSQTTSEPFVEIHPADAAEIPLAQGDLALVSSRHGNIQARVRVSDTVRRGELFAPMHWSDQFANQARVGALVAGAVDPHSGQPELKHTAVRIEPADVDWFGFALCRDPIELEGGTYLAKSRGEGYCRSEIAGQGAPPSWSCRAREIFGDCGEWVELDDASAGRYRGALLEAGRLIACLFVSSRQALPDRTWLGSLFALDGVADNERRSLLAGRPAGRAPASGPIVCSCFSVGRDALIDAIASQQASTSAEIGKLLRAGTNCGSCIPELNGLIHQYRDALDKVAC